MIDGRPTMIDSRMLIKIDNDLGYMGKTLIDIIPVCDPLTAQVYHDSVVLYAYKELTLEQACERVWRCMLCHYMAYQAAFAIE